VQYAGQFCTGVGADSCTTRIIDSGKKSTWSYSINYQKDISITSMLTINRGIGFPYWGSGGDRALNSESYCLFSAVTTSILE
jgi:hypothetical protein